MQGKKGNNNNNENKLPPNYVHLQSIHAENIKHEYKYENRNKKYDYTFNPFRCKYIIILVYPLTEKPQNIHPKNPNKSILLEKVQNKPKYQVNIDPIEVAFINEKYENIFKNHINPPKQKYNRPQTANQEIGWYSQPLMNNQKWNRPVSSTPITQYVSDYDKLKHINPFKLPVSRIKMK